MVAVVERHFTTAQLAALLAVHPETIRRAAARGELESVRIGRGSERRYPESGVQAWLRSNADERDAA